MFMYKTCADYTRKGSSAIPYNDMRLEVIYAGWIKECGGCLPEKIPFAKKSIINLYGDFPTVFVRLVLQTGRLWWCKNSEDKGIYKP